MSGLCVCTHTCVCVPHPQCVCGGCSDQLLCIVMPHAAAAVKCVAVHANYTAGCATPASCAIGLGDFSSHSSRRQPGAAGNMGGLVAKCQLQLQQEHERAGVATTSQQQLGKAHPNQAKRHMVSPMCRKQVQTQHWSLSPATLCTPRVQRAATSCVDSPLTHSSQSFPYNNQTQRSATRM